MMPPSLGLLFNSGGTKTLVAHGFAGTAPVSPWTDGWREAFLLAGGGFIIYLCLVMFFTGAKGTPIPAVLDLLGISSAPNLSLSGGNAPILGGEHFRQVLPGFRLASFRTSSGL